MIHTLTCENGKEIDMTSYILQQLEGKITKQDVLDRIEFYKSTNRKYSPYNLLQNIIL